VEGGEERKRERSTGIITYDTCKKHITGILRKTRKERATDPKTQPSTLTSYSHQEGRLTANRRDGCSGPKSQTTGSTCSRRVFFLRIPRTGAVSDTVRVLYSIRKEQLETTTRSSITALFYPNRAPFTCWKKNKKRDLARPSSYVCLQNNLYPPQQ